MFPLRLYGGRVEIFKLVFYVFIVLPNFANAQSAKPVEFNLKHQVTCPKSGTVKNTTVEKVAINLSQNGSEFGDVAHMLEIRACDLTFWVNLEVRKAPGDDFYKINVSQILSRDGINGFEVSKVICETSDLTKFPNCANRHMPTIDPLKQFIQTSFAITATK